MAYLKDGFGWLRFLLIVINFSGIIANLVSLGWFTLPEQFIYLSMDSIKSLFICFIIGQLLSIFIFIFGIMNKSNLFLTVYIFIKFINIVIINYYYLYIKYLNRYFQILLCQ